MTLFKGACTALVTPFTSDEKVNFECLKKQIEHQIDNNISAIVFLGTTGEASTMTNEEKDSVVKFAVKQVNKRIKVIAGSGSNCTKTAIETCQRYEKLGVDALLVVTPYYNKATQNGLIAHYNAIANSVKVPIIIYNVPGRTGLNILPATVKELSKNKNIIAIKEASGNIEQMAEIHRLCKEDIDIYSGDDALILPALSIGAKGVISVASNIIPRQMNEICLAFEYGRLSLAKDIQLALLPLIKLLFSEVNPIPIKKAMEIAGFDVGAPRLPLLPAEESTTNKLISELKSLKIV